MNGVPLNINFQQILLHLLNFTILFMALYFILYKPVKKFMDKRVEAYKEMDDKANLNLKEAEEKKEELDKKIRNFDIETKELKVKARKEMDEQRLKMLSEAKAEAEDILIKAEEEANNKKTEIIKSAEKEITEMIAKGAEKVISGSTAADAFDEFLKETENK